MNSTPGLPDTSSTSATGVAASAAVAAIQPAKNSPSDRLFMVVPSTAVPDDRIRCPEERMGIAEQGLAVIIDEALAVHQRKLGLAQRLSARQPGIGSLAAE